MAEPKSDQEPSIEEILESIRQIISEDGEPEEQAVEAKPAPAPEPVVLTSVPKPEPKPAPATIIPLDLINKIDDSPLDLSLEDAKPLPVETMAVAAPEKQAPAEAAVPAVDKKENKKMDDIVSPQTASVVTEHLSRLLAKDLAVEESAATGSKVTLEDLAREAMKPLIKAWIDQNLPALIEKIVQKEVEKLAHRAIDR